MTYLDYKLTRQYMKENMPEVPIDKDSVKTVKESIGCLGFIQRYYVKKLADDLYKEYAMPLNEAIKKVKKASRFGRIF